MSEKHIPRHRRMKSKELHTAWKVLAYLREQGALLPTVNGTGGDLADVIGLGMGTVRPEDIPVPKVWADEEKAHIAAMIDD